jgi:YYY domain-containing protein
MLVKFIMRWRPLALLGLCLLGLALRLYNLNWDQGNNFHPDERQILFHVVAVGWPSSLAQFFDPVKSPLNPHFFAYGSFPIYILALLGHILLHPSPDMYSLPALTLVGRALSAIFDSGTIFLTAWLALLLFPDSSPDRRYAWGGALLAAALVAFTPFQLQLAHFYAVDSMLLFFVVCTLVASIKLIQTEKALLWTLLTGLSYGLALATKFSAAPLAISIVIAVLLRWYQRRDIWSAINMLLYAALVTVVTAFVAQPYAFLDWQNFVSQVSDQGSLARGMLDLPYVRQFAGTIPVVYQVQNMVLWGMGLTLGLVALAGLGWFLWRFLGQRKVDAWLVVLAWVVIYGAINCSFYVKFMRYMLPIYPLLTLMAAALPLLFIQHEWKVAEGSRLLTQKAIKIAPYVVIALMLLGTIFQGLALLNVYSAPNTRVQASRWIFSHLQPGSVLTYEQWDDPLPVAVDGHDPTIFPQETYNDASGNPTTGLALYDDDTDAKAGQLANLLPKINAITMATDRLDKSIPRLPSRYPLTIHYYQLLFSGQLGFHLAAQFENRPHLLGITLDDSSADESYSVFDHPTAKIFVRDNPYPYTSAQLYQKLTQGVELPAPGSNLSGSQRSLLLSSQQIQDNQQSPSFGEQFPPDSFANQVPLLLWWLVLTLLGLSMFPLVFPAFRALADRGYIFGKLLGLLLLAYLSWLLAATRILTFSRLSVLLIAVVLIAMGGIAFLRQRSNIMEWVRQHLPALLWGEILFSLAFLFFVSIRMLNPDVWSPYRGGEKPMELAFLNAILRSPHMPPLDPWFAGGYINYYYYGYVIFAALIKLTGILPTTAFNLAIPTLFALTFTGAVVIVYSFVKSIPFALLGGYFAALIGNLDGLVQIRGQIVALLTHSQPALFDYWQSSRIIPFTINEFPFWSFLFADLHPHVIDMPIAVCMLGILATLFLSIKQPDVQPESTVEIKALRKERGLLYLIAAFIFGTIACVNPWDAPVYALLLAATLLIQLVIEKRPQSIRVAGFSLLSCLWVLVGICMLGYGLYLPFYSSYQQLYVNGLGLVKQGSSLSDFLLVFGFWLFLAFSFFLYEWHRRWIARPGTFASTIRSGWFSFSLRSTPGYIVLCVVVLLVLAVLGVKFLLAAIVLLGLYLLITTVRARIGVPATPSSTVDGESEMALEAEEIAPSFSAPALKAHHHTLIYTYLLLLMGVSICLGIEVVYVRDFLDGGDYARMNTVFKFSMQAWLCLAIGGALVVYRFWHILSGIGRRIWMAMLTVLVVGCSLFLTQGTAARIADHQLWVETQTPAVSADYVPTLDGFAFVRSWYPADAAAIEWLNAHVSGSPVILEAVLPDSYQWGNRISVYTGLPDVLGWPDHEGEQRYNDQVSGRVADIVTMYTTPDTTQALALLRHYHVRYVYVGPLERQTYAKQSSAGLDKFNHMAGLRVVYHTSDVTIYEVI